MAEKCKPDCPECGGNGAIGGDLESPWVCSQYMRRINRERQAPIAAKGDEI